MLSLFISFYISGDSDTDDSGGSSENDSDSGEDKSTSKPNTPSRNLLRKTEELDIVKTFFSLNPMN